MAKCSRGFTIATKYVPQAGIKPAYPKGQCATATTIILITV